MRIALVVPEFPPSHIGGGGIVFQSLYQRYRLRHEVRVFSGHDPVRSWWGGRLSGDEASEVFRYPLIALGRHQPHLRTVVPPAPRSLADLASDLRRWMPEVAHLHGYGYTIVDLSSFILRRRGVPYVFTNHGFPITPSSRSFAVRSGYRAYKALGPDRVVAGAAFVTGVSSSALPAGVAARRSLVVPNGLEPLPPSTEAGRRALAGRLGLTPGTTVVAAAGRLTRSKGFDVLIDAVSRVRDHKVTCVIAGLDGGEEAALADQARRLTDRVRVVLSGPMDRSEVADLFTLASVVAVPSRAEPFGLVALEAAAMGRRVVASRVGGLPDFLPAAVARLVPPEDAGALASALEASIVAGPAGAEEAAAAVGLAATYSWEEVSRRYEDLLIRAQRGGTVPASGAALVRESTGR